MYGLLLIHLRLELPQIYIHTAFIHKIKKQTLHIILFFVLYRVAKKTEQSILLELCSNQQLSFYTLLDIASFSHYNNTKIIKFGWELFILWVISYGLSFSGFAISLSLIVPRANPENDSP